jgi:cytochrome P450
MSTASATTSPTPAERFLNGIMSPDFQINPYSLYDDMRTNSPLLELVPGEWFLFRHDDVLTALRHPALSSDERRSNVYKQQAPLNPRLVKRKEAPVLLFMDAPDHTRLRRLVARTFTTNVVAQLREKTVHLVNSCLDNFQSANKDGDADLIEHVAHPVPVAIICELIGIPASDVQLFQRWSEALSRSVDPGFLRSEEVEIAIDDASAEINEYLNDLANARKHDPNNDLLSALLAVEEDGDRITREELLELMQLLLIAGHETTVNLIGNSMLALANNQPELRKLTYDMSKVDTAVDEFMRYDCPVQISQRIVTEPIELRGQRIGVGEQVVLMLGAANRDPGVFEKPDQLDFTRNAKEQIGFGGGIHYCLGAALARMETTVTLTELLKRFPKFELAATPERRPNFTLRGPSKLLLKTI